MVTSMDIDETPTPHCSSHEAAAVTPGDVTNLKRPATISDNDRHTALLDCLQSLVQSENQLTRAIEDTDHLIPKASGGSGTCAYGGLPAPRSMKEVHEILALSRTLASRTSAPSGWNPNLPVVTFATPNPLPHQLRGGALAAMQLNLAKQKAQEIIHASTIARDERKENHTTAGDEASRTSTFSNKRKDISRAAPPAETENPLLAAAMDAMRNRTDSTLNEESNNDNAGDEDDALAMARRRVIEERRRRQAREAVEEKRQVASMNLSDSDSSSDDEEEGDDDDEKEDVDQGDK